MPSPSGGRAADAAPSPTLELLQALLIEAPRGTGRLERFWPTAGTLHAFTESWSAGRSSRAELVAALRAIGQVILINNPLSGALVLLALVLQSGWLALFVVLGIAGAHAMAIASGWESTQRAEGIVGFNGALVGGAAAGFADPAGPVLPLWFVAVPLAGAASSALLEGLRRWWFGRTALPPLSLPACLVGWLLLGLPPVLRALGLAAAPIGAALPPESAGMIAALPGLAEGIVRAFGQVFFCERLGSGLLVLAAVALASPVAALLGVLGALTAALSGLLLGLSSWDEVISGTFGFNGVLVAIAVGGIFFAPNRRSVSLSVAGAALTVPIGRLLLAPMAGLGLPLSSLPFVLATWLVLVLVRRTLPALVPVAFHAVLTPEEHRRRFRVARRLLLDFRRRLQRSAAPTTASAPPTSLAAATAPERLALLRDLYGRLDRDASGALSPEELRSALGVEGTHPHSASAAALLDRVMQAMDLDGDGRLTEPEFVELVLRLQQLLQGHQRLLTYLLPLDANADDQLDRPELARLLCSVGARPLTANEERWLFGAEHRPLSWAEFVDRLLLS